MQEIPRSFMSKIKHSTIEIRQHTVSECEKVDCIENWEQ